MRASASRPSRSGPPSSLRPPARCSAWPACAGRSRRRPTAASRRWAPEVRAPAGGRYRDCRSRFPRHRRSSTPCRRCRPCGRRSRRNRRRSPSGMLRWRRCRRWARSGDRCRSSCPGRSRCWCCSRPGIPCPKGSCRRRDRRSRAPSRPRRLRHNRSRSCRGGWPRCRRHRTPAGPGRCRRRRTRNRTSSNRARCWSPCRRVPSARRPGCRPAHLPHRHRGSPTSSYSRVRDRKPAPRWLRRRRRGEVAA